MSTKDKINQLKKHILPLAVTATMMSGTACQNQQPSEQDQSKDKIENVKGMTSVMSEIEAGISYLKGEYTETELYSWQDRQNKYTDSVRANINRADAELRLFRTIETIKSSDMNERASNWLGAYQVLYDIDAKKFMEKWGPARKKLEDLGYKIDIKTDIAILKGSDVIACIEGENIGLNGDYKDIDPILTATGAVKKVSSIGYPLLRISADKILWEKKNEPISAKDVVKSCIEAGYHAKHEKDVYYIFNDENIECAQIRTDREKGIYDGKYIEDNISSVSFLDDGKINGLLPLDHFTGLQLEGYEIIDYLPEYYKNLQQQSAQKHKKSNKKSDNATISRNTEQKVDDAMSRVHQKLGTGHLQTDSLANEQSLSEEKSPQSRSTDSIPTRQPVIAIPEPTKPEQTTINPVSAMDLAMKEEPIRVHKRLVTGQSALERDGILSER